jgi:hypothetical protein
MKNGEVSHRVKKNILHTTRRGKGAWMGHILNKLLKKIYTGGEDEEEDVSRYWMTLRKREDPSN